MDTLDTVYYIAIVMGTVFSAVCGVLSLYRAHKRKDGSLFYYLLSGFFACVFMSNVFYLLIWLLLDYPFVISPGDLSWVGAIFFLITADLDFMDKWTPEQKETAKKYRLPALAAPAVCVVFNASYISIYPDITANYLLYGIPMSILSYFALWIFLSGVKGGVQATMRSYHLVTLVWIAAQLLHDLFSTFGQDYGYAVHITIFVWFLMLVTPCVYIAARKEAGL